MNNCRILVTFCCTHTHTRTHICIHTHTHAQTHIHTHTHTHTHTHSHTVTVTITQHTPLNLTSQTQPTPAQITFSITHGKGLVMLGRFSCATLRLPRVHCDWLLSHGFELILILKVICTGGSGVRLARLTLLYCQWSILISLIISFLTCPKFLGVLNILRTCLCSYLYFIRCPAAEYALQIKSLMGISLIPRPTREGLVTSG